MTNADKIREMSNEEMANILLCPYDTAGKETEIMPCLNSEELPTTERCHKCIVAFLEKESE